MNDDREDSGTVLALLITATASTAIGIALVAIWWGDWSTWP